MKSNMRAVGTILVAAMSVLGCSVSTSTDAPPENVGQTSADLSIYQWSADYAAGDSHSDDNASIATFNANGLELTFMVHTGADSGKNMYFAYSKDGATWGSDQQIPNMYTSSTPHMAAFNGYLYMIHQGADDPGSVWMSRFNTSTWSWGQDYQLPYRSWGTPSLASYNGALYIVGNTASSGQVWQATMSATEVYSPASNIPGVTSLTDAPSLAVHCPGGFCYPATLYMAYRTTSFEVGMSGLQVPLGRRGTPTTPTWWTPWVVVNTDGTHKQTGATPALASYGGNLHLIDTPLVGDYIEWSYYDGSSWSLDVNIRSQRMWGSASLAPRSNRLSMVHSSSRADHSYNGNYQIYAEYFQ